MTHGLRLFGVRQQVLDRPGNRGRVERIDDQPTADAAHYLPPPREIGGDHRKTGGHVLEQLVRANRVQVVRQRVEQHQADPGVEQLSDYQRVGLKRHKLQPAPGDLL